MPRALSMDLRQRAVLLYRELGSYVEVARRLSVRPRWVSPMVARPTLEPDYGRCGNTPKLDGNDEQRLRAWLAEKNDLTLDELRRQLREHRVKVCRATVANTLARLRLRACWNIRFGAVFRRDQGLRGVF